MKNISLHELMQTLPQTGQVQWIGTRPAKRQPLASQTSINAVANIGLEGDHYASVGGKRQVTLIQSEHLSAVSSMLGNIEVAAQMVRRNIVVSGINLLGLKDKQFRVGRALLEYTGLCRPCSYMEEVLGAGGYNAMRGHGGINARIIESGVVAIGDEVSFLI